MIPMTLAAARVNAGYKQKEAAPLLGITARTLRNYETFGNPPLDKAVALSELYLVPMDRLFFGTKTAYRKAIMEKRKLEETDNETKNE